MIAVIEIPQGSLLKYEVSKVDGSLMVDRMLNQPVPFNYGYFPGTLCEDTDPLDVFVLGNVAIQPLARVKVEIIGVIECLDNGLRDDKIFAIIEGDQTGSRFMGIDVIICYLTSYKKGFEIIGMGGKEEAMKIFLKSVDLYENDRISNDH